jgi:hypothetical protein
VDAATLQLTVDTSLLRYGGQVGVEVRNPDPSGGLSNSALFNIHLRGRVLLPLIKR